ncbi:hypothetical protein [Bradyrhizobium sp. BR 1432]|uniref:hypothetical protein n=1 Tax=Bradyrhizobium sp. BR 1432 TaxID=3447966 RepID=UPI003EE70D34
METFIQFDHSNPSKCLSASNPLEHCMSIRRFVLLALVFLFGTAQAVQGRDVKIATSNLRWHLSQAEAKDWIRDCGQPFALNPASGLFEPSTAGATKPRSELKWGAQRQDQMGHRREAPCDVDQANFKMRAGNRSCPSEARSATPEALSGRTLIRILSRFRK